MDEFISRDEVQQIARLARLRLSDAEIESLRVELTAILEHMNALRALDTDGIEPMTHVATAEARSGSGGLRADEADISLPANLALAQAPRRSDDFFVVPNSIAPGDPERDA